jgi:hypothetical protein
MAFALLLVIVLSERERDHEVARLCKDPAQFDIDETDFASLVWGPCIWGVLLLDAIGTPDGGALCSGNT